MKKTSQIVLFATVLSFMTFGVCFAQKELSNLERLAISAVNADMAWTKDVPTNVFPVGNDYIEKHKIMGVRVNWGCPARNFTSRLTKMNRRMFLSYIDMEERVILTR